ncbi:MAG TPA: ABC transporter permease, partial [Acidimicrobiales bacterium]
MSDGSSARVERRSLEDDAFRIVSARDSLVTRLRNLWNRRELLSSLIRSDIRIKYKNSALGIVWSMLTPTLFLAIYWLVFAKFLKNGIPNFVVYLFAGMIVWNMFNTSLSTATGVIVVRSGLVKKVSFPREILALANVGAATFYFFIQVCVFGLYLLVVDHSPDYAYFWLLPFAFLALYFFTAALAIVMSAVTVYMRDMEHFILIILQLWFFMSPIVYSYEHSIAPQLHAHGLAWLYFLNPITLIMLTFQRTFYVSTVVHSTVPTVVGGHVFPLIKVLPSWPMSTYFYLDIALLGIMIVLFLFAEVIFGRLQGNFESEL